MTTTTTTPSEPTGIKLTKEIFQQAMLIREKEGGDLAHILKHRFKVMDFNPYEHYYGFNIPDGHQWSR